MTMEDAKALCDAVLDNFERDGRLREFYPPLDSDPVERSFLWAHFATTGMLYYACKCGLDYREDFRRFIDALKYFRARSFSDTMTKYHSGQGENPDEGHGDCFFDDNIWVARNLLFAYEMFGDPNYLKEAQRVAAYVYTGWNPDLGGLVWNERGLTPHGTAQELERGLSANACAILVSAQLYVITGEKTYLDWAHRFYDFCKTVQDPDSGIYYNGVHTLIEDGVRRAGDVNKDLYAYNSGSMILANLALYGITRDSTYVEDAVKAAKAVHEAHIRYDQAQPYYHDFNWFFAVFMEGCHALLDYAPKTVKGIFQTLASALEYAETHKSPAGLLPHDYITGWRGGLNTPTDYYDRNLLTHSGTAEIAVLVAAWQQRNTETIAPSLRGA